MSNPLAYAGFEARRARLRMAQAELLHFALVFVPKCLIVVGNYYTILIFRKGLTGDMAETTIFESREQVLLL